ncbi:MotA/TolQ/ExbB proton channel family protein [Sunxiuqinia sp. A32]|uniref:MotA/TolQ/ExbB proton channel family protein n=1 Tax=Sunxiuqinia sp. A32 TaxID=3461496 RepID=UPI0040467EB3
MSGLIGKFNDGGPIFTYLIFILLLVIIGLFIKEMVRKGGPGKTVSLINHIAWFAVAWGFLGRTFGLIDAFDKVAAQGELTPRLLADGLKMALVDPLFGIFVFLVARVLIIVLVSMGREKVA